MRPPSILGKSRKSLKFMNAAVQKYLSTSDLHAIVLDSNDTEKDKSKEDNSSKCSTNEEEIDSDVNSVEDVLKHTKKEQKEKNNMIEGSTPDFKEKTFCHSFGIPIRNEATVDNISNETINDKKRG